ncbi:hypothetical protein PRZ48_000162 [Zasmidium cellare]|uniref:C2H2-type domain-containing protein n=1 Tax=Zasmidium cellare TaxID=395010 RepID=A0ABR0EZD7_ZASCE|nr:hypothetical protein PRZ48_000162 [Zasmidium cellare]
MADDDLNSSDIEFEPAQPKLYAKAGQASIERLIQNSAQDRLTSKKRVKQLAYGRGAPSTRRTQSLWVNRFEAYRQHTLKQSLASPFCGADLIRFLDSILGGKSGRLRGAEHGYVLRSANKTSVDGKLVKSHGKPAPNDGLAWTASKYILEYGTVNWTDADGFSFTARDHLRLKTFIGDCVDEGRLTAGHWNKRTWLGFVTLSRMVRTYLSEAHSKGVNSWDIVIARCLSVVLLSSLGTRSGDIALSQGYKDEYIRYEHIELYLVPCDDDSTLPSLANLRATVTVQFAKGMKNRGDEDLTKYLAPLADPSSHHMCPISLLMVHALRHGMIEGGSCLTDVLRHAFMRPDKRIVWTHPRRPVMPMFSTNDGLIRCLLDKPANTNQLLASVKKMGKASGVLERVYAHAVRLGGARDAAHISVSALSKAGGADGLSEQEIGRLMGHTDGSRAKDTTHRYVGDTSVDVYTARAESQIVHLREPKFALDAESVKSYVSSKVTPAERDKVIAEYGEGQKPTLQTVDLRVRQAREAEMRESAMAQPRHQRRLDAADETISPMPPPLAPEVPSKKGKGKGKAMQPGPSSSSTPLAELSVNVRKQTSDRAVNPGSAQPSFTSNIDPALLRDGPLAEADGSADDSSPAFSEHSVFALSQVLFPGAQEHRDTDDTSNAVEAFTNDSGESEAALLFLGTEETAHNATGQDGECKNSVDVFVDAYSRTNVVRSRGFADHWDESFAEQAGSLKGTIANHCDQGNSRDPPTPFVIRCQVPPNCTYTSIFPNKVQRHEETCTEAKQSAQQDAAALKETAQDADADQSRRCPRPNCSYVSTVKDEKNVKTSIKQHIKQAHDFEPRECEVDGCMPGHMFTTKPQWQSHQLKYHSGRWPTSCRVPGCAESEQFSSQGSYNTHLKKAHGLHESAERLQYYPPSSAPKGYVPKQCVAEGCTLPRIYKAPVQLKDHLMSKHDMDEAAALKLVEDTKTDPPRQEAELSAEGDDLPTKKPTSTRKRKASTEGEVRAPKKTKRANVH